MDKNKKTYLTIGELVKKFNKFYPDLTSSKLRFLESRGLVIPGRAENRYRIYFKNDVRKINIILKMQKEFFLPLEVIKEKLETINFEKIEKNKKSDSSLTVLQEGLQKKDEQIGIKKLSVEEVCSKIKNGRDILDELISEGFVSVIEEDGKSFIEGADLEIIRIAGELTNFGIRPKHLKLFENSAVRHSSFLQQIIYPLIMTKKKESFKKASKLLYKLENSFIELNEKLFKKENKKFLSEHK